MIRKNLLLFLLLGSCALTAADCKPQQEEGKVNLIPDDSRPVFRITVADPDEVALLEQELKLKPIYMKESFLYFHDDPQLIERLKEIGYEPTKADPYQVYQRVVRVTKKGEEKELLKMGVRLINREKDYWIMRGSLAQLIALERLGYHLTAIAPHEPRPREVKIKVSNLEEVAWLNTLQVDIFTVRKTKDGLIVYGGAFDYQIDSIRERGLDIELIDTVGKGEKK